MRLWDWLDRRRNNDIVREITRHFDDLTKAGVADTDALYVIINLARIYKAPEAARKQINNHPPIKRAIDTLRTRPFVKEYLGEALILKFPHLRSVKETNTHDISSNRPPPPTAV